MKLYTVIITAAFLCIISSSLSNALFYGRTFDEKIRQYSLSYSAKKFIAQSFKNTCRGKGFKSLDQWQLVCKSLFSLDSISYEESGGGQNNLMHAKWKGSGKIEKCSGEVYIKKEEGSL